MLSRLRLLTTLIAACLLTACQPAAPEITPEPSFQCTPEAGGEPYECSARQHEEMVAKDQLYTEAEAVYRKFFEEDTRLLRSGGTKKPTKELLATATGAFLEDSMEYYRYVSHRRARLVGGTIKLDLTRAAGLAKGGSLVALRACIDASSAKLVVAGKKQGTGHRGVDIVYFGRIGDDLMIQGADGEDDAKCS